MSSHKAEEGGTTTSREPFQGWLLPLNSKKVTSPLLKQLARGLADSPDKLRQLIKGKLSKMACEPRARQVCLQETCGTRIGLQDAKEIFLNPAPKEPKKDPPDEEHGEATRSAGSDKDFETLQKRDEWTRRIPSGLR